jgi:hypothetical protein
VPRPASLRAAAFDNTADLSGTLDDSFPWRARESQKTTPTGHFSDDRDLGSIACSEHSSDSQPRPSSCVSGGRG